MKFEDNVVELNNEDIKEVTSSEVKVISLAKANQNKADIMELTDELDLGNVNTLVNFGSKVAEDISKCSDSILNSVELDKIQGASNMMTTLMNIMSKFDAKDLEDKKSFMNKVFGIGKDSLEKMLGKYNTMGTEIEKVYVELKKYDREIDESNTTLEVLYNENMKFYQDLTKYILAGEEGCRMIDDYKKGVEDTYNRTKDETMAVQIQNLNMGKQMLEQRVQDLRIAENVALQSIPMIKAMQYSNLNLKRKINSAFIITLPIFKQGIAQAILLKKQRVQADAMAALDERTNEMLLKNAQNTVDQVKLTTELASGSSVKIETLEATWRTIVSGIEETKVIQERTAQQRVIDREKLESMKSEYNNNDRLRLT